MKVVFISNFLNHHQLPFCDNMYVALGEGYKFIQTEPVNAERLNMGYEDMEGKYPYIICPYKDNRQLEITEKVLDEADFVIVGSAPIEYLERRLKENKPVLRFLERFLRHQKWRFLTPKSLRFMYNNHTKYRKKKVYLLCASAYAARDFALYGAYKNKTFKWGYFPEVLEHDIDSLIKRKRKDVVEILWVARFLKLKHPEKFLKALNRLKEEGIDFNAKIIGSGECEQEMRLYVEKNGLEKSVSFLGTMPPSEVRKHMESSNIFVFNSDYREGWGAVINESMNSGCGVISSHAPGAVPFLIEHGKNGLVYNNRNFSELYSNLKKLVLDRELCETMGKNAYQTMKNIWNAKNAVEKLIELLKILKSGKKINIESGPCSVARPIPQRRMYKACIEGEKI